MRLMEPMAMGSTDEFRRHAFRAMGTTVQLVSSASASAPVFYRAIGRVERIFAQEDARLSRFRSDSELSWVNANAGSWTDVSHGFSDVLSVALAGARRTGGLFDPTVLPALIAAGYDRDYAEVRAAPIVRPPPPPGGRWRDVEIAEEKVQLPVDVAIDFGGVGKGWTVDLAAEAAALELPWALVDAGGDVGVVGHAPSRGVEIGIEDPYDRTCDVARLRVQHGALATSSVLSRRWGEGLHQIIDPRTSLPARSDVVQATVWDESCANAEISATWALLAGVPVLDHVSGVLVMRAGEVVMNIERAPSRGRGRLAGEVEGEVLA